MTGLSPGPTATWQQWRHRVGGCLLMTTCAEGLRHQLPAARSGDDVEHAMRSPKTELQFGPVTRQTLALAVHLIRHSTTPLTPPPPPGLGSSPRVDALCLHDLDVTGFTTGDTAAWISPLGLLPHLPLPDVAEAARRTAARCGLDHTAQDVAAAQAVAVAVTARQPPSQPPHVDHLIAAITTHTNTVPLRQALQRVRALAARPGTDSDADLRQLAQDPAVTAFALALRLYLTCHHEPRSALSHAMLAPGPDAAAMTAALLGAHGGDDLVPTEWGSRLRSSLHVWSLAGKLAELITPPPRQQPAPSP